MKIVYKIFNTNDFYKNNVLFRYAKSCIKCIKMQKRCVGCGVGRWAVWAWGGVVKKSCKMAKWQKKPRPKKDRDFSIADFKTVYFADALEMVTT